MCAGSKSGISLITQSAFITTSSLRGFKVVFRVELKGRIFRTVQYYFDAPVDKKFVLNFAFGEADWAKLDPVCDDSAKTFRFEKQVGLKQSRVREEGGLSAGQPN